MPTNSHGAAGEGEISRTLNGLRTFFPLGAKFAPTSRAHTGRYYTTL